MASIWVVWSLSYCATIILTVYLSLFQIFISRHSWSRFIFIITTFYLIDNMEQYYILFHIMWIIWNNTDVFFYKRKSVLYDTRFRNGIVKINQLLNKDDDLLIKTFFLIITFLWLPKEFAIVFDAIPSGVVILFKSYITPPSNMTPLFYVLWEIMLSTWFPEKLCVKLIVSQYHMWLLPGIHFFRTCVGKK